MLTLQGNRTVMCSKISATDVKKILCSVVAINVAGKNTHVSLACLWYVLI